MGPKLPPLPPDLAQLHPGLGILRLAALCAEEQGELDTDALDGMLVLTEAGALDGVAPAETWPELARGLMSSAPGRMIMALQACGALAVVLPEIAGLFGVPDLAENGTAVDLGEHLVTALAEAARRQAPLEVRFALLVRNAGKTDSPSEHLPVHYRHIERGHPRIDAICDRLAAPESCRRLAHLALDECERVHRVSEIRAGPIALMLERLCAFDDIECFRRMMTLCCCDYAGFGEHAGRAYDRPAVLEKALAACADIDDDDLDPTHALEELRAARAAAIAVALRSERWSG